MKITIDIPEYKDNEVLKLGRYIIEVVVIEKNKGERATHHAEIIGLISLTENITQIFKTPINEID